MKRIFTLFIALFIAISMVSCKENKAYTFSFPEKAKYMVTAIDSEIKYTAILDGEYQEYIFISPSTISGLTVKSIDGIDYTIEYNGLTLRSDSKAIEAVANFYAAIELLKTAGSVNGNNVMADIGTAKAIGHINDKEITKISYTNCGVTENYEIKTEATG